ALSWALALWPLLRAAAGRLPTLPSVTDKKFIDSCVRVHNELRGSVRPTASSMRYMTWHAALARMASARANKCILEHNVSLSNNYQQHPNFTSVGENIWFGSRETFVVADAIKSWYNEVKFYNFTAEECTKVCSHYIQVVWDDSYKIGCAVTSCKEFARIRNAAVLVCCYSPCGNSSRRPYIEGTPCSNCTEGDTCEKNLCITLNVYILNKSYLYITDDFKWQYSWEFRALCNKACITLVFLRASLLFLTFIPVCYIQKHFTDLHMAT
ncbi:GRPL2 protein, partial [Urocolius indicus]|nr:GRPL2 protein [Urocolius indicus]